MLFGTYFVASVVVFSYVLGEAVGIAVEIGRLRRLRSFFQGGLTSAMIHKMDRFQDGQVCEARSRLVAPKLWPREM